MPQHPPGGTDGARATTDGDAQAVARRDELLRTLVHELRTPTTAIEALVRVLGPDAPDVDDDVRRDAVALVALHAEHLRTVLDDVDALRRSGSLDAPAGGPAVDVLGDPRDARRRRQLDLATLVLVAADAAGLPRARIELDLAGDAQRVHTDPSRLRRVLTNLLENAARHGSAVAPVRVTARRGGDHLELQVADHGDEGGHGPRGEGIGLRVVAALVSSLGGEVDVSDGGDGRTVRVRLPD